MASFKGAARRPFFDNNGTYNRRIRMAGENERLFSLAGRMYVMLRRQTNRMIDVEWAITNADYAKEIVGLARATGIAELVEMATHLEELHPLLSAERKNVTKPDATAPAAKYVAQLR
jgi:hypothetical protein